MGRIPVTHAPGRASLGIGEEMIRGQAQPGSGDSCRRSSWLPRFGFCPDFIRLVRELAFTPELEPRSRPLGSLTHHFANISNLERGPEVFFLHRPPSGGDHVKISLLSVGIAASMLFAGSASAQTRFSQPEVSLGYQMLHIPHETFPLGLNVDVSSTMNTGFTLVGEFGWAKDDQDEPGVGGSLQLLHYGAGPRWTFSSPFGRPFAQIVAGGVHTEADTNLSNDSDDAFMLQPGVGLVVPIASGWGAVGQFDYRRVFFKEEGDNEWRVVLGVRLGLPRP
jgi:hypothetical protein